MRNPLRVVAALLALSLMAAACSSGDSGGAAEPTTGPEVVPAGQMTAVMASSDLYAGAPQRVQVGLVFGDGNLVSYGEVAFAFAYTGTQSNPIPPEPGPDATARFIPTPGASLGEGEPTQVTAPSTARGVYEASDITFPKAGVWTVEVTAELTDGTHSGTTTFLVDTEPRLPAPGQPALETETLSLGDETVPLGAIDSRAISTGSIPDPKLHAFTIADAISANRVALVLFATPAFCMSQFCGPSVEVIERMDDENRGLGALFIHVEIWKDYEKQQLNDAAIEWLYRDGDLQEPWLYLIGKDGLIVDRWGPLFDPAEVLAEIQRATAA